MAHINNGDMVTMALLQGIINAFVIFFARLAAYAVSTALGKDGESIGGLIYWLLSMVFQTIFGILASIIVYAFSRWREYHADFGGAKFAGKQKMIAALQRLQKTHNLVDKRTKSLATMKISDKRGFMNLFSTHPSLELRIQRLQQAQIN